LLGRTVFPDSLGRWLDAWRAIEEGSPAGKPKKCRRDVIVLNFFRPPRACSPSGSGSRSGHIDPNPERPPCARGSTPAAFSSRDHHVRSPSSPGYLQRPRRHLCKPYSQSFPYAPPTRPTCLLRSGPDQIHPEGRRTRGSEHRNGRVQRLEIRCGDRSREERSPRSQNIMPVLSWAQPSKRSRQPS